MALRSTQATSAGVSYTIYDFDRSEDALPTHVHFDPATNHITIVARGSVRCIGAPEIEGMILKAGATVAWVLNRPHGFVALEDFTRVVNVKVAP